MKDGVDLTRYYPKEERESSNGRRTEVEGGGGCRSWDEVEWSGEDEDGSKQCCEF
jgi:hypothetical protein